LKELIETLVRALVQDAGKVSVTEQREGEDIIFEIDCDPADRGRVIGKKGRTIEALRTLVGATGERRGEVVDLEVLD
jgi:predicted RNA-binding protein YlqC (UPF0109 family)